MNGEGGPPAAVPNRIVLVVGTTSGGTGRHVRMLAAGLTARGAEVVVCGPDMVERRFGFEKAGAAFVPVEIADRPRPARDLAAVLRLRQILLRRILLRRILLRRRRRLLPGGRPDTVHAHGLRAGALTALALRPFGGSAGPALVVTLHNAPPGPGLPGAVYRLLERIVARRADSVLCVSGDLEERIRRRGARAYGRAVVPAAADEPALNEPAADQPAVDGPVLDGPVLDDAAIAPAAPAAAARSELGAEGRPLVLAGGRLAPQKGFGTLLDAAGRWRDRRPQPLLLIAGDGPLAAALAARIDSERLPARLVGHRGDLPALMAAADVLVLPSVWEGQPLFVQEALRSGTPLVATRVGGVPDLTGEDAAVLVPHGDPERLATAILRVLQDTALAERLHRAARLRARSLPSEDDAIVAVLAEYRRRTTG